MERRRDIVYNYGVEIETVLVPKGGSPSFTTNEFFLYLRDFYNQSKDDGSMEAHTDICGNVSYNISDPGYTAWTFTTDITIDPRDELLGTDHRKASPQIYLLFFSTQVNLMVFPRSNRNCVSGPIRRSQAIISFRPRTHVPNYRT